METFSALLALCAGYSPVTDEFPSQRPLTRSFDIFFDLLLNKRLRKQPRRWWFERPSHSLWRHCSVVVSLHAAGYLVLFYLNDHHTINFYPYHFVLISWIYRQFYPQTRWWSVMQGIFFFSTKMYLELMHMPLKVFHFTVFSEWNKKNPLTVTSSHIDHVFTAVCISPLLKRNLS